VNSVQQNIKCGIKRDKYFVDEVETQLREKPLQGSYKVVALTYP